MSKIKNNLYKFLLSLLFFSGVSAQQSRLPEYVEYVRNTLKFAAVSEVSNSGILCRRGIEMGADYVNDKNWSAFVYCEMFVENPKAYVKDMLKSFKSLAEINLNGQAYGYSFSQLTLNRPGCLFANMAIAGSFKWRKMKIGAKFALHYINSDKDRYKFPEKGNFALSFSAGSGRGHEIAKEKCN